VRQGVHRAAAAVIAVALTAAGCGAVLEPVDPGPPSAEVLALAEEMAPTDAGREAFLDRHPRLASHEEVDRACLGAPGEPGRWGCTTGARQFVLYDVPDDRLHGYLDDVTHGDARTAGWQAFAVLGSSLPGALSPALEARYAQFLTDRVATVGIERATADAQETLSIDLAARYAAQATTEQADATARAVLELDAAGLAATRASYNASVEQYNAAAPELRARWTSSWTLWDGTVVETQQTSDTLAAVRDHLELAAQDQQARRAALDAADAAASASRAELDAEAADLEALWALLGPPDESGRVG